MHKPFAAMGLLAKVTLPNGLQGHRQQDPELRKGLQMTPCGRKKHGPREAHALLNSLSITLTGGDVSEGPECGGSAGTRGIAGSV